MSRGNGFVAGFASGVLVGALGVGVHVAVTDPQLVAEFGARAPETLAGTHAWLRQNLGLSAPVFAAIIALYVFALHSLERRLQALRPPEDVARAEQLVDIWTGLFFGTGVIWTAIGMRAALLQALGNPETAAADGALTMLTRLVDGGILLALSTTIVGGVGGYLMRVVKTISIGAALEHYWEAQHRERDARLDRRLRAIERGLNAFGEGSVQVAATRVRETRGSARQPGVPAGVRE